LTLAALVALSACTRDNPAFRESNGSGESGTSDASTSPSDETTTGSDAEVSSTTEPSSDSTEETGGDPMCMDIPEHFDFLAYFATDSSQSVGVDCSIYAGNFFFAESLSETELHLTGPCDEGCTQCGYNDIAFGFEPAGEGEEPNGDAQCVYVAAEAPAVGSVDDLAHCYFKRVAFWGAPGPETPLLVVSGDGVVPESLSEIPGPGGLPFGVSVAKDIQCECGDVEWCCEDAAPPTTFKMLPTGTSEWAYNDEMVELQWGDLTYEFINARAYDSGHCEDPQSLTWVLQIQDPSSSP
jgi:hypothetical protein